jgi:hypothetical protein
MLLSFTFGRPYGCLSLAVLVLDIYCIVKIVEARQSTGAKVLWILLVVLAPLLGAILWLLLGKN